MVGKWLGRVVGLGFDAAATQCGVCGDSGKQLGDTNVQTKPAGKPQLRSGKATKTFLDLITESL